MQELLVVQKSLEKTTYTTSDDWLVVFSILQKHGISGRHVLEKHIKNIVQESTHLPIIRYRTKHAPSLPYLSINSPSFLAFANDKRATYQLFSDRSPHTYLWSSLSGLSDGQRLVKPRYWYKWRWIRLFDTTKSDVTIPSVYATPQYIIQSFQFFTWRVAGNTRTNHDIRCLCLWNNVLGIYIRQRKPGGWTLTKTSRTFLDLEELDSTIHTFLYAIIERMDLQYPKQLWYRSIDFAVTQDTPTLIEINGAPGVSSLIFLGTHTAMVREKLALYLHNNAPSWNTCISWTASFT